MASSTHEVVVLGANFAGVNITHYLQRQVFPILAPLTSQTFHLTLVSPNSHFYFKVAAPRALINATLIPAEKIFKPLSESLAQYGESATFLQGKATAVDTKSKTVTVGSAGGEKTVKYDSLFICTGTTTESPLWTIHDDHELSAKALKEMHQILPKTKSVLIAGAGPVGVETAGEIAATYPDAQVTLVSGGDVLEKLPPGTINKAKQMLQDAKVEVITNVRVNQTSKSVDGTKVELSDGSSKTVELYIDARGPTKVNSDFLPKSWLDSTGHVNTRDSYFRVKGDGAADVTGIYAVGDIVTGSANTAIELDAMVPCAASSFAVDVATKAGKETTPSGGFLSFIPGFGSKGISQKEFKPMKDTILVPIGPNGGVGQAMGWSLPSFAVKKGKAEKFLVELVEPAVTGSKYAKVA
jgi:NADH dehydrogenase FAD-containing subunit